MNQGCDEFPVGDLRKPWSGPSGRVNQSIGAVADWGGHELSNGLRIEIREQRAQIDLYTLGFRHPMPGLESRKNFQSFLKHLCDISMSLQARIQQHKRLPARPRLRPLLSSIDEGMDVIYSSPAREVDAERVEACCFCAHLAIRPDSRSVSEKPLYSSDAFEAWASLGAMVEGWTLVIPRTHSLSVRGMPRRVQSSFRAFTASVSAAITERYGPTLAFEHGAGASGEPAGCGIDHAHLHLVPMSPFGVLDPDELLDEISAEAGVSLDWFPVSDVLDDSAGTASGAYVYVGLPERAGYIAYDDGIPGQLVRRVLATRLGRRAQFDWREYPERSNVLQTIRRFSDVASSPA